MAGSNSSNDPVGSGKRGGSTSASDETEVSKASQGHADVWAKAGAKSSGVISSSGTEKPWTDASDPSIDDESPAKKERVTTVLSTDGLKGAYCTVASYSLRCGTSLAVQAPKELLGYAGRLFALGDESGVPGEEDDRQLRDLWGRKGALRRFPNTPDFTLREDSWAIVQQFHEALSSVDFVLPEVCTVSDHPVA